MAIPVLNDLDLLNSGQIIKFRVENAAASGYSNAEAGALIYDSGSLKFYNGSSWITLGTGSGSGTVTQVDGGDGLTGSVTSSGSLAVGAGTGITVNANDVAVTAAQTGITSVLNTSLKVGRDADNDIDFATDNTIIFRVSGADQIKLKDGALTPITDDDIDLGSASNQFKNAYFDGTVEVDALTIGGVTSVPFEAADHTKLDGIATGAEVNVDTNITISEGSSTVEIQSSTGTNDSIAAATTSAAGVMTAADKTKLDGIEASANVTDTANVKAALNANLGSATFGDSNDTITIPGNLVVSGTQTVQNETVQVVENNTIQFEGTTADANEIKLTAADASSDKTITLPDLTGHVALLAAAATETISATPAELNILDGVTSTTAELNILDGVTATASELNILDGVTSTTSEINILDGFTGVTADLTYAKDLRATGVTTTEFDKLDGLTASTSELNKLDGVTATTSELNILDGVTASTTEINLLDGITTLSGSNTGDEAAADETTAGIIEIANAGEAQAGTNSSKALTPHNLNDRHAKAVILSASVDSTALKAVVPHVLGTKELLVEVFGATTGERYIAEYHTDNDGSSSNNHLTFHFSAVPSENLNVYIVSVQGTTAVTPTYPTS